MAAFDLLCDCGNGEVGKEHACNFCWVCKEPCKLQIHPDCFSRLKVTKSSSSDLDTSITYDLSHCEEEEPQVVDQAARLQMYNDFFGSHDPAPKAEPVRSPPPCELHSATANTHQSTVQASRDKPVRSVPLSELLLNAEDTRLSLFLQPLISQYKTGDTSTELSSPLFSLSSLFPICDVSEDESFIVFHRKCYDEIFEILKGLLDTQRSPKIHRLVITGTPGIGKSHSFFSLLPRLLRDGRVVGYDATNGKEMMFFELDEHQRIRAYDFNCRNNAPLMRKWLLQSDVIFRDYEDAKSRDISGLRLNAVEVLLSSPRRKGFQNYINRIPHEAQLVLPPFSESEMTLFGNTCYATRTDKDTIIKDALQLYTWFGGVPRWCFEKTRDYKTFTGFFKTVLQRRAKPIVELCRTGMLLEDIGGEDNEKYPHRLLYILPVVTVAERAALQPHPASPTAASSSSSSTDSGTSGTSSLIPLEKKYLLGAYEHPSTLVEELLAESLYVESNVWLNQKLVVIPCPAEPGPGLIVQALADRLSLAVAALTCSQELQTSIQESFTSIIRKMRVTISSSCCAKE